MDINDSDLAAFESNIFVQWFKLEIQVRMLH